MANWITKLQAQPKSTRDQVAFVGAVLFTAIIVGLWTLSLPSRYEAVVAGTAAVQPALIDDSASTFMSGVRERFGRIQASWQTAAVPDTEATSSAAVAPEPATTSPNMIQVPVLSESEINQLNQRPIQIATSSATSNSPQ